MNRNQATEQEDRPAAFRQGSMDLDYGSLSSSQGIVNSNQKLCSGCYGLNVVALDIFG